MRVRDSELVIGRFIVAVVIAMLVGFAMYSQPGQAEASEPTPTPPLTVTFSDDFTTQTLTAISLHQAALIEINGEIQELKGRADVHRAKIESLKRALAFRETPAEGFGYDILSGVEE